MNITKANNLTEFSFNESIVNNSDQVLSNIVTNANTSTDGYFGLILFILIYMFLNYVLLRPDGLFRYDWVKGNVISSGVVVIIGFVSIVTGLTSNFQHVMWFVLIFIASVVSSYFLKKKNL